MCSNVVYGLYELKIAMYGYVHAMLSWMYLLQQDIPNMNKTWKHQIRTAVDLSQLTAQQY